MKKIAFLMLFPLMACPLIARAQEAPALLREDARDPSSLGSLGSWSLADALTKAPDPGALPRDMAETMPDPAMPLRGAAFSLLQDEIAPRLHFGLGIYARVDVPGDTSVDSAGNIAYSDVFDVGYGVNAEASLMSWVLPHFAMGGYLSVGWDRFTGASNVDMGTGEFFTFNDQDTVTVIAGAKIFQKIGPFWFWEGRMGVGLVHYDALTFSDVTTPVPVTGLQFFRPVNHGLFDLAGRFGFGTSRLTFDVGMDFRFMGSEARGRDVTNAIDPDWFFVFALDLGVSFSF
ncbi:MAG TPA: hypothetical protein VKW04_08235 [Planctomycetota bacterium]|nr:hypothetical protein [Planctomycetota bacterium]